MQDQTPSPSNELEYYNASLEYYKAQLKKEELEIQKWSAGFKEIIGLATLTIKSLILINGGAIATILAFLGNTDGKYCKVSINIGSTLNLYLWGLGLAILCSGLAYIFQTIELEIPKKKCLSLCIRFIACVCALGSFICFNLGCHSSISMFSLLSP